ncbi:kinase-like protein [Boletus reticuloceps]|uniref:Kinase-like protein n=1 Tax=Boletus reticuloceps TaxID=495285 RepID=A0A8I3A3S4_9AGAM|nr:kinase-like protein [Boletus reticuloceps]
MSLPCQWAERKDLISSLLQIRGDDDEGIALDRVLHGQNTIGKTSKTIKIDSLRFTDKDLVILGTLDRGQFGVIDVVKCVHDGRVYVRKSIEKIFALRFREQCSPQIERDILLLARDSKTMWAPHLLCSFQTSTHLNLVMEYAEGGTLWDVLESSPHDGRVLEADLEWWAPQAICAIHWCHTQGFAHRDIKPHNFVLTSSFHLRLIDFGSAAPLSPPEPDGSQNIPQRHSLVPCGTCDYISPEILQAHEDALLALELSDQSPAAGSEQLTSTCGLETDWWSLGVMLYELVYGVAPFFANDIRTTYLRIMNHETSLRFDKSAPVSASYQDLLQRLLTSRERRLGRRNVLEITEHPFFKSIHWAGVGTDEAPSELHVPYFTNPTSTIDASYCAPPELQDESVSQPFHFSALFQSSISTSPGWSILRSTPPVTSESGSPTTAASFIGFSWGPPKDAFLPSVGGTSEKTPEVLQTPRLLLPVQSSPYLPHGRCEVPSDRDHLNGFVTPVRPYNVNPYHTLPRTNTIGRTPKRRTVSDREAMRQLVGCIGMSARKKVLASGRKPRILDSINQNRTIAVKKELRFRPPIMSNTDRTSSDFPPAVAASESEATESGSEGPPSPSPRPGSAMSMLSRRSTTPTTITSHSTRFLSLPSSLPPRVFRVQGYRDWDDEVFARLENRHAVLVSQLYGLQAQLDCLRELIEP